MTYIVAFPTMTCNLKCGYCGSKYLPNSKGGNKYPTELDVTEWIDFLNDRAPYHLELSGGEPTFYSGFAELIACVPKDSEWAITSNTQMDGVDKLDLSRCVDWTASYHEAANLPIFFYNLEYLKKKVPVSVSMVFSKKNWQDQITTAMEIIDLEIRVNMIRAVGPDRPDDKIWGEAKQVNCILVDDIKLILEHGFECQTGHDYFMVAPDGSVFRCVSDFYYGDPVGSIESGWVVSDVCHNPCMHCDKDVKHRGKHVC